MLSFCRKVSFTFWPVPKIAHNIIVSSRYTRLWRFVNPIYKKSDDPSIDHGFVLASYPVASLSLSRWKNCAQRKSGRRNFLSFSLSWTLALRRLSLAFRAHLCAKIDAPKEEAGIRPLFQLWLYERQNSDNENHKAKKCDLVDLFQVSLHDV